LRGSAARAAAIAGLAALTGAAAAGEIYHGSGTVTAVLPRVHQLVIDAGDIPGYMSAMEMNYAVEPAGLLDGLKAGDRIAFDIDGKTLAIVRITVIKAGK
jgi:Cu/Ag efflux protein CusF